MTCVALGLAQRWETGPVEKEINHRWVACPKSHGSLSPIWESVQLILDNKGECG